MIVVRIDEILNYETIKLGNCDGMQLLILAVYDVFIRFKKLEVFCTTSSRKNRGSYKGQSNWAGSPSFPAILNSGIPDIFL